MLQEQCTGGNPPRDIPLTPDDRRILRGYLLQRRKYLYEQEMAYYKWGRDLETPLTPMNIEDRIRTGRVEYIPSDQKYRHLLQEIRRVEDAIRRVRYQTKAPVEAPVREPFGLIPKTDPKPKREIDRDNPPPTVVGRIATIWRALLASNPTPEKEASTVAVIARRFPRYKFTIEAIRKLYSGRLELEKHIIAIYGKKDAVGHRIGLHEIARKYHIGERSVMEILKRGQ